MTDTIARNPSSRGGSAFALTFTNSNDVFLLYNELPGRFLAMVWGKGTIAAGLKTQQSHYVRLVKTSVVAFRHPPTLPTADGLPCTSRWC